MSSTTASNPTVVGLLADTTYTVIVTDVNGCKASDQMVMHITNNTPSINITSSGSMAWCAGTNSSVNLTAIVTGGTTPLSYSWSGADINPVNSQVATVYPNSAGTYTYVVTVTDGFNCTATANKSIHVNAIPTVNAGAAIHNICVGTTITIGGNPTATGGEPPYTYAWNSGANAVANPSVSPVNSTTYIVTVTDSAGCSASASTTVLVRPTVTANAGSDKTIASCPNACTDLGGSPAGSGGSGSLTYAWSPSTGLNSTSVANPRACGLSGNVLYSLTVTDTAGCTATDQVSVTVVPSSLSAEAGTGGSFCIGSGDSIMLGGYPTAVGGTPIYTYTWSPTTGLNLVNPANPVAYATSTIYYHLTVTDAQGCTATDSTQVRVFPAVQANAGNDTTVCEGLPARLGGNPTATGGIGGYTYVWSPSTDVSNISASNPLATPFTTTDYSVVVTDSNGCHATNNIVITVRPKPVAQAGPDKSIFACPLDSVVIGESPSAVGGTPPYTFVWTPSTGLSSTSATNPIVTGISSTQTYILTVTDSLGCKGADNVVVNVVPSTLQVYEASVQQLCSGPNSCVQLGGLPTAIGGTSPYTYSWSGTLSNPSSSNPIACPSSNAVYGVTVTDSKGCSATSSESVIVKQSPVVNAGNDTAICLGQSAILGGHPTASGGTGHGYTYSWIPTVGISSALVPNPVSNATATTTYTVTVADSNGCSSSAEIVLTVRPVPTADAGADKSITICAHDSTFIGNIPVASGGTAPYTYQWTPAGGLSSTTVPNPIVSGITQTTSYQILVTDTFGCKATDNVIVNVTQQTLQAQAGSVNVICASANTPVTIGGTPSVTGGTGPYIYSWSPATGLSSTSVPNPIATVSASTTYYLTVTDAKGCISVDSVKIIQNPAPTANAGTDTALCLGFGKTLGGNPTATGGKGSYQYSWTPTIGLNANNTSNPSAFPSITTTYQVVVTDSNGCQASDAVTITINQNPTANAGTDVIMTSCIGDTAQIGGTPSASGGAGGYIYNWSPASGLSSASSANPFVTGLSTSALYALTVTDANGCSASDAMLVSVTRSNLTVNAGSDVNICAGNNTIVTLGGNPTSTGGSGIYSYSWSPASSLNSTVVSNPFATPSVTTGYSVTVTDSRGCTATDSVVVIVHAAPIVSAGTDTTVCAGNAVAVGGNPTASGFLPFTYSWAPSAGVSNTTASNPVITAAASTIYTVVVSDGHGCTASSQVAITVHQNPIANAGPDKTMVACNADSVRIGGTPSASGGTGPYIYAWSPATGVSSASAPNPYVSHLGSSANFTLLVTDQYGCSASDQMNIAVTNSTLFADAGNNVTVCQGASGLVILGGIPTASGGTPSYTYAWSPAAGLSSTTSPNPAALPSRTTLYTLVVTDAAGCIATDTVDFIVNPKPVVNAGPNDTVCQGICVAIGGTPTADGSPASNTYNWAPASTLSDPAAANPTACPITTTRYNVTVTNQYGCTSTAGMTVKVNANPTVNAGADQTIVTCPNSCITIGGSPSATGGTGPYTYNWSPPLFMDSVSISNPTVCNPKEPMVYGLVVTDANGCTAIDEISVTPVSSTLTADAGPDKTVCAGQNTCITIGGTPSVIGGSAPYTVRWSPGTYFCGSNTVTNPQVNPVSSTTYTLFVVDALGCTSNDTVAVYANPTVTAIVRPDTSVCSGSSAILGGNPITGGGGTPPYTYSWSPTLGINSTTASNPTVTTLVTTSYCVTVTDSVGCSSSACQAVIVSAPLLVDAGPDKTISGCPNATVVIGGFPAVRGGSGNYIYSWTPAAGLDSAQIPNPRVQNLTTSTVFTLVVTDRQTGCSSSDQVMVTVSNSTLTVNAGSDQFLCYDNSTGIQIGGIPTASGGQGPYVYHWSPALGLSDTAAANPIAKPSATTTYALYVTDALGCSFADTVRVTVVQKTTVSIIGLNTKYCLNAGVVNLVGTPAGGTFSGPGVVGTTFQPLTVGVGRWCITYSYKDAVSGCVSDTVVCVTVDSLAALAVSGYSSSYCHLDSAVTLVASPPGGTFSGTGISGNIFNPANANSGNNIITYTYIDTVFGCSNSMQFSINVIDVPVMSIAASDSLVCPGANVNLSAQYSTDVFNIAWSDASGNTIYSGLNGFTVNPSLTNHCFIATAVNTTGCVTRDTLCIQLLNCYIKAVDVPCDADSAYMNSPVTIKVVNNDTLPASGTDTIITIRTGPITGTAVVNGDHTITYTPAFDFSGNVEFVYQVCIEVKGYTVCDTASVCVTVVDTTIHCHFPNTITPNNDGVNDEFQISCNDEYPNAEIRIYDRWGAEVFRSMGHYLNDFKGYNQQGIMLPDGTYFYMYYYNNGTNKMKAGFVDILR